MAMTRKHFKAIADVIKTAAPYDVSYKNLSKQTLETKHRIALELSAVFYKDNPKFNTDKFLQACGVTRDE